MAFLHFCSKYLASNGSATAPEGSVCRTFQRISQRQRPIYLPFARSLGEPVGSTRTRVVPSAKFASGAGVSDSPDTATAVSEALAAARTALPSDAFPPSLCIAFTTVDRTLDDVAAQFHKQLNGVPCIGITSCGNVLTTSGPVLKGVSALLLTAASGTFASASASFSDTPSSVFEATVKASKDLKNEIDKTGVGPPKALYMSATPGNEEYVLRGIHHVFGTDVPIIGGSAADNDVTGKWGVFHSGSVYPAGLVLFSISGPDVSAGAAIAAPYKATERSATVTKVDGRKVVTLDNKPAADVLYSFVGSAISNQYKNGGMILGPMSSTPMSLRREGSDGAVDYLSVHVASINHPERSISLFKEAKVGDELTVMDNGDGKSSAETAGSAIQSAYSLAKKNGGLQSPSCAVLVYCGGLSIAVGEALKENMTADFARVAPATATGMTAFGEQGPLAAVAGDTRSNQHCNLTVSMLLLE